MKCILLDRRRDIRLLQLTAMQFGFNISGEVVEQLADQLQAARAWHAEAIAKLKAELDAEIAELRAELEETRAAYAQLKALSEWSNDRASLQ
jgi:hypothetical protein